MNYKTQAALRLPIEMRQVQVAALHSGACSLLRIPLCLCLQICRDSNKKEVCIFVWVCTFVTYLSLSINSALSDSTSADSLVWRLSQSLSEETGNFDLFVV